MKITYPKEPKFVSYREYLRLREKAREEVRDVSPRDKEAYEKALIEYARRHGMGFAFAFFSAEDSYIAEHYSEEKFCKDYASVNEKHSAIQIAASCAMNDYVLSHDGVIDSWPQPESYRLFKIYRRTEQYDDSYKDDPDNALWFTYNFFAPPYVVAANDTFKSEQRFKTGIERTVSTHSILKPRSDGPENNVCFWHTKKPELREYERKLWWADLKISTYKAEVRGVKWNRFKSAIAWIPAGLLLLNVLFLLYWTFSGKQDTSDMTVLQSLMQVVQSGERKDIWNILILIPLLPTLLCVTVWHLAQMLPPPFPMVVCLAAAAVVAGLALAFKYVLNKKLGVEKPKKGLKTLKKEYAEAQATVRTVNADAHYLELLKEEEERTETGKKLCKEWGARWFEEYKQLLYWRDIDRQVYESHFKTLDV